MSRSRGSPGLHRHLSRPRRAPPDTYRSRLPLRDPLTYSGVPAALPATGTCPAPSHRRQLPSCPTSTFRTSPHSSLAFEASAGPPQGLAQGHVTASPAHPSQAHAVCCPKSWDAGVYSRLKTCLAHPRSKPDRAEIALKGVNIPSKPLLQAAALTSLAARDLLSRSEGEPVRGPSGGSLEPALGSPRHLLALAFNVRRRSAAPQPPTAAEQPASDSKRAAGWGTLSIQNVNEAHGAWGAFNMEAIFLQPEIGKHSEASGRGRRGRA